MLKEEVTEQYWGLAWQHTLSDESKEKAAEIDRKKISRSSETSDITNIDANNSFLIKPSSKRGSPFGQIRGSKRHKGIDYPVSVGTNIVMLKPGEVTIASMNADPGGYGAAIYIKHYDGVYTRYGHLSKINVNVGDKIKVGDVIGKTGGAKGSVGAGNSQGAHLHFEYRPSDVASDPASGDNDDGVFRFAKDSDIDKLKIEPSQQQSNGNPKVGGGSVNNSVNNNNSGNKSSYILGKKMVISPNGPRDHGTRPLGNWQSDNATDIFGTPGTIVYSITKGRVSKIGGNQNNHKGKIYGAQITIKGYGGYTNVFYTHLQNVMVKVGQEVTLGTPLAEISLWETSPSGSHVHVGLETGSLNDLLNLKTGEIK